VPLRAGLAIDRTALQSLSRPAPWRLSLAVLFEWICIVLAVLLALQADRWWADVLAIAFIATRQHGLLSLMHEFTHRQFSRTNEALNDTLGDLFTALPFMITVYGFRRDHLAHHRNTSTSDDPNWVSSCKRERYHFPKTHAQMAWVLLKHCFGAYAPQDIRGYLFDARMAVELPRAVRWRQALFWAAVIGTTAWLDSWLVLLLYWTVPMFTVLMALLYLRDVGEHFAMPHPGLEASRTVLAPALERWTIAPYGVSYHAEHHVCPAVPFCRLPELHQHLRRSPAYEQRAVITRGYLTGLLREVARAKP